MSKEYEVYAEYREVRRVIVTADSAEQAREISWDYDWETVSHEFERISASVKE